MSKKELNGRRERKKRGTGRIVITRASNGLICRLENHIERNQEKYSNSLSY